MAPPPSAKAMVSIMNSHHQNQGKDVNAPRVAAAL